MSLNLKRYSTRELTLEEAGAGERHQAVRLSHLKDGNLPALHRLGVRCQSFGHGKIERKLQGAKVVSFAACFLRGA